MNKYGAKITFQILCITLIRVRAEPALNFPLSIFNFQLEIIGDNFSDFFLRLLNLVIKRA